MNGITYVKLQGPYSSNTPKNAPLTVVEMDSNFATLEGRDIQSVSVENDILTINLYNGTSLQAPIGRKDSMVADVVFDHVNGILTVALSDGSIKAIEGFATKSNTGTTVAVDNTLVGNGLPGKPIGISPVAKTGWYRPVERIINVCENQQLPSGKQVAIGERYLTIERVSDYGYLYDYNAVRKIACDLRASNSPWRIPSKADWDDMLDAIEPSDEGLTHSAATANKYLGQFAGKLLKSRNLWRKGDEDVVGGMTSDELADPDYNDVSDDFIDSNYLDCATTEVEPVADDSSCKKHCHPMHCGDKHHAHCSHHHKWPFGGLDKYGFRVTPSGYADDGGNFIFFRERAAFWTSTNSNMANAYVKRFEYNKNTVHQDIIATQNHLSIRLVKDYDGTNFNEREDILGQSFSTVIMPSAKKGSAIWTSVNVNFGHQCYAPMIPNDGQGMSFTLHFFINEWNGKEWVRNEIRDGESVIVKFAPDGSRNSEYRVVEGHIANVAKSLIKTVSAGMRHILNKIEEKIDDEITLSSETNAAQDIEIETLKNRIDKVELKSAGHDNEFDEFKEKTEATEKQFSEDIEGLKKQCVDGERWLNDHEKRITEAEGLIQGGLSVIDEHKDRIADLENKTKEGEKILGEHEAHLISLDEKVKENTEAIDAVSTDLTETKSKLDEAVEGYKDFDKKAEELHDKLMQSLPVQEGSGYDKETGKITIKSRGGENDIIIQVSGDYGEF